MPGNRRSIPELRDRLREVAIEFGIPELLEIVDELYLRSPVRRARSTSQSLTPALAAEIRVYARANPSMSRQAIAVEFNVNHGRVSKAMNHEI